MNFPPVIFGTLIRRYKCFLTDVELDDGTTFRAAHEIGSKYAAALKDAIDAGVEVHAWRAAVSPDKIWVVEPVPKTPN